MAPLIAPPTQRMLPQEQPEIVPPAAPTVETPEAPPAGPPVRVDRVQVEGVTVYDEATLRGLYGDVVGAAVPRARLDEVVQALQTRYREDGYILTLVRGEFQRTNEGQVVFVIRATEGYISDVKLDGDIGPAGTLVLDMLQRLTNKRPVNNQDLERYLLLANDIPGVTARAVLRREGLEPGAVLLVAQVARKEVSGLLSFDNRAPPEAGPYETSAERRDQLVHAFRRTRGSAVLQYVQPRAAVRAGQSERVSERRGVAAAQLLRPRQQHTRRHPRPAQFQQRPANRRRRAQLSIREKSAPECLLGCRARYLQFQDRAQPGRPGRVKRRQRSLDRAAGRHHRLSRQLVSESPGGKCAEPQSEQRSCRNQFDPDRKRCPFPEGEAPRLPAYRISFRSGR